MSVGRAMLLVVLLPLTACGDRRRDGDQPSGDGTSGDSAAAGDTGASSAGASGRQGRPYSVTQVPHPMAGSMPFADLPVEDAGPTPDAISPPDLSTCPEVAPDLGADCTVESQVCTYGDSVRADCRSLRRCLGGRWEDDGDRCAPPPDDYCPPEPAPGTGCVRTSSAVCEYAGPMLCTCDRAEHWRCDGPPATEGCPEIAPNIGTECSRQGVSCRYGDPCSPSGASVVCRQGTWYPVGVSCSD